MKEKMFDQIELLTFSVMTEKPELKLIKRKSWTNSAYSRNISPDINHMLKNNWNRPLINNNLPSPFVAAFTFPKNYKVISTQSRSTIYPFY